MATRSIPATRVAVRAHPTPASAGSGHAGAATPPGEPAAAESFLGRGWAFPLALADDGEVALVADEEDVRQAIAIILGTSPGERVMRPEFGAGLNALVFEPMNTTTFELIRARVQEALARWEPRILVREVRVRPDPDAPPGAGRLRIEVRYTIRASNTDGNLVYPFYLLESRRP
jgi:phage baseplate assembly protein W